MATTRKRTLGFSEEAELPTPETEEVPTIAETIPEVEITPEPEPAPEPDQSFLLLPYFYRLQLCPPPFNQCNWLSLSKDTLEIYLNLLPGNKHVKQRSTNT